MKTTLKTLSNIRVESQPAWESVPFLTIDIDWAHDKILEETIDLVEEFGVPATWFVTHETPLIDRLQNNPNFEVGLHPNFNFLMQGDKRLGSTATDVLDRLMALVPNAKTIRSHSTTQNSYLLDLFLSRGLTHESNMFIPTQSKISVRPWALWTGLIRVPYIWEDDVACLYGKISNFEMTKAIQQEGLKVFDFHPIHIFLNTENMERYEKTRKWHKNPSELRTMCNKGDGTKTRFYELLNHIKNINKE